ncbi:hypothetical protein LXL04_013270 [Taraxacum kok-saghyz]
MATNDRHTHQVQVHTMQQPRYDQHGGNKSSSLFTQQGGPSTSKVLAVMALLPIGGILLGLAGITLVGSMIGLAIATPVFIIFSPIIVPAVLTIGLAVAGFLTSGTFGLTGLSSLSFLMNSVRQATGSVPEQIDYAKMKLQDMVEYTGQKTKEVGQTIQEKAHEIGPEGQVHGGAGAGTKEGRGART